MTILRIVVPLLSLSEQNTLDPLKSALKSFLWLRKSSTDILAWYINIRRAFLNSCFLIKYCVDLVYPRN